ncbi:MAG: ABC transporter permease [Acidilobaceae archaeon]
MTSSLRQLAIVILWDVRKLSKYKFFLAMRFSWFIFQVLLFGYIISNMVDSARVAAGFDYYKFYIAGSYVAILFSLSALHGYDIIEEFEDGIINYHLSLPISRRVLTLGRVLGGGLAVFILSLPMSLILAYVMKAGVLPYLGLLAVSLLFSLGLTSGSMALALTLRASEKLDVVMGTLDSLAIRLSTAFYPITVIASIAIYYYLALGNPVSHVADSIRYFFGDEVGPYRVADFWLMAAYILGFATASVLAAMFFMDRRAEGGYSR